jgi:hypothetical protein
MATPATTITIHDPDGNEFEMTWSEAIGTLGFDEQPYCDFCDEPVPGAWFNDDGAALFVLCEDCATSHQ